jgi:hypothetical protein
MKITGGNNGPLRPDATRDERLPVSETTSSNGGTVARIDTVEISDAGRAKAAETVGTDSRSARLQDVRERILRGAYDTDEVVGEVARRILDAGHLQVNPPSESQ